MGCVWHIKGIMIAPDVKPDKSWLVGEGWDNVVVSLPLLLVLFWPRAVPRLGIRQVSGNQDHCRVYQPAQIRPWTEEDKMGNWKCATEHINMKSVCIDPPSSMEIHGATQLPFYYRLSTLLAVATEKSCQASSTWRYEDLWSGQTNLSHPRCSQPSPREWNHLLMSLKCFLSLSLFPCQY